jgi:desulfoferrodoxin-like iron-binding protein
VLTGRRTVSRSGRVKEGKKMAVTKPGEKFRCNICHNEVTVVKAGGGTLVCCGTAMVKVEDKAAIG